MLVNYQASSAEPTWKIWRHFQQEAMPPRKSYLWHEDFETVGAPLTNTTSEAFGLSCFLSDGGLIADAGIASTSAITATSNDDNEAVVLASATGAVRITKNSGVKVAFGCRFRADSITDSKNGFFYGLFEPLVPTATSHIGDDGALTDKNFVGIHRLEGDGDKADIVYKADSQSQQSFADALTLAVDTWYKFEFYFDGLETMSFWLDGTEYTTARLDATDIDAATFPDDANLGIALVLHKSAASSAEGSNLLDWVRYAHTFADAA